jgi:ABC-type nitrate/sulfonate/bicarbonate transport system substrate-binding protein
VKRSTRSSILALAAVPALALGITACAGTASDNDAGSGSDAAETVGVRLAATSPLAWPQAHVATGEDSWADAGLDIEQTEFATGRDALQALLGGGADIAEVSASNVVSAAYAGNEVVVLARGGSWGSWNVIADADAGISAPEDLIGKRIGVTTGTSSEISLSSFLTENGIDVDEVELVNVSPADMTGALSSGSVDAVNPWQPNAAQTLAELGDSVTTLPYEYTQNYLLATTPAYLEANPDTVTAFIEAYKSADASIADDPAAAAEWVSDAAQLDVDTLTSVWADYTFDTVPADDIVVSEMTDVAALLTANGSVTGEMPDFASLFHQW